jgi:DNA-binding response OmpR family regulator
LFQAAGFEVASCGGVAAALDHVASHPPELVITDLQLGADSGANLVEALAPRGLPVMVVSGAVASHEGEGWRDKAAAIYEKPVSPARLIVRARELVAERRAGKASA